jgi:EAL domain-containing protein (putative c-di-GMP-specific phosphodiesterase class I)
MFEKAVSKKQESSVLDDIAETLSRGGCFRAVELPIHTLEDEKLVGYELVSRGPDGNFKMPDQFFEVCRQRDILTTVDLHCFRACAAHASKLAVAPRLHINLFPDTLAQTPVEDILADLPERYKAGGLCIEINEQQFLGDMEVLCQKVVALKRAGILLAVDDVGFGASSVETLLSLEPDIIKIDHRFVDGAAGDTTKERRLRRLVRIAEVLGAETVAEGVNNRQDLALLKQLNVFAGQGLLWPPSE